MSDEFRLKRRPYALTESEIRSLQEELDDERHEREIWEGAAVGAWKRGNALKAERDTLRLLVEQFANTVDLATRSRLPPTGMHVPYHGDFAAANPSAMTQLEWWARAFREALTSADESIPPRVTDADFEALADVRREVEQSGRQAEALRRELELDAPDGEKEP